MVDSMGVSHWGLLTSRSAPPLPVACAACVTPPDMHSRAYLQLPSTGGIHALTSACPARAADGRAGSLRHQRARDRREAVPRGVLPPLHVRRGRGAAAAAPQAGPCAPRCRHHRLHRSGQAPRGDVGRGGRGGHAVDQRRRVRAAPEHVRQPPHQQLCRRVPCREGEGGRHRRLVHRAAAEDDCHCQGAAGRVVPRWRAPAGR